MITKRIKAFVKNAALLIVFSILAFATAEIVVRVLFKDEIALFPGYHTDARYGDFTLRRIRPNSRFRHTSADGSWEFVTNARGFRNYEDFAHSKPDGVVRVLSLGDSHTQGYEVRQDFTFSAAIEKYLEARGLTAEVLNTGVSGFSTAEELAFLENEGIKYEPDAVVLGFYANDYEDNAKAGLYRLGDDGKLSVDRKEHIPGVRVQNLIYGLPLVAWLSENSYFYSLLFNTVWDRFKDALSSRAAARAAEYAIPLNENASDYEVELMAALLSRMKEFCERRNVPLIIIDIPRRSDESIRSSLDPSIRGDIGRFSDGYVDGASLLREYVGVAEIHRPRGNRHITEFTHVILGVAAARQIQAALEDQRGRAPKLSAEGVGSGRLRQ